jgi:drug/metabolite transporter (DMT)-like permease
MRAIIFNLLAHTVLPINYAIAKYLSAEIPIFQIIWVRHSFTVILILPIIFFFFKKKFVWTEKPKLQLIRGLLLLGVNIFFYYAVSQISLAKALTLTFISPLVVTVFSSIFLIEKVGIKRWSAVIVGFIGVIIVIRPGYISLDMGSLSALCAGTMYAFYLIITRKLSMSDNSLLTLLITGIIGTFGMSLTMPFIWVTPTLDQWYMLSLIGIITVSGHFLIILSFKSTDASKLAPISYFEVVTNTIFGYFLFNHFPDNWTLVGLVVIISSGLFVFYRERKIGIV